LTADLLQGFYLGDLLIEPARGSVTGPGGSGHLPPKAIEVLLCLCAHPGEVVARDALLEDVWGAGAGSQEALSHAVSEIRHVLGDHRSDPEFIQTLPKRGYRLLVQPVAASGDTATIVLGARNSISPHELGLFENLKQRGVLETGIAYLILGWLLIQVADIVFDQLLLPRWVGTFVTVLVISGFPIAIILSWFLEFRHGRATLHELTPRDARRRRFSRTYVSVIGALGIAAVLVFIYDKSIGLPEEAVPEQTVVDESLVLPPVLDNSIAVLPFVNLDGSETTKIFSNGLVDDVITRLSRVPGLLVSSRGDSFTLEPNSASAQVRKRLRVAMYLEGSVQMLGDEIRVIVQLIDSETGFHVLSRSFDRPREDFFDIRDEITELTVANVRVAVPSNKGIASLQSEEPPTLDAYLLYRRGVDSARSAISTDSVKEALHWFDQALAIDPDYAAAHAGKCEAYVNGYGETQDTLMIDSAQAACVTALQLNPNLDIVHTSLGRLYLSLGRLSESETAFKRALEIDPSSSESFIGLGEVYSALNRPEDAEANFRQAIGLHPGDWAAYNRLGNYLYRKGRYTEAAQQYQYTVALDHSNSNAYSNLGTAFMLAGNFVAALPAFQKSLEIDPKAVAYSNLGLLHYYLGEFDESIRNHRRATDLAPNDHLLRSNLGDALWNSGDIESARQNYRKALALAEITYRVNPSDPFTMMDIAWLHAMLDAPTEAATHMSRARDLAPHDPYTHYYDGLILFRNGDVDEAIASFRRAVEIGYPVMLLGAEPHLASLHTHQKFLEIISSN
jgi:tetratricopeptide (TPR) repeat protein/TolB-like protein/DNA-binding winged helix-turn-helix (wHTH) protein